MQSGYLVSMSAIITFGIGILIFTSKPAEWVPSISDFIAPSEPVLVVIVGSTSGVEQVRAVISDDRVVAETDGAFATYERRIIAASAEAASGPINEMGWIHREIDVVAVPMAHGLNWEKNRHRSRNAQENGNEDPEKASRIAELMSKPTLTTGEAMAVLSHMDATGQF